MINRLQRRLTDVQAARATLGDVRTAPVRALAYLDGRRSVRLAFLAGAAAHRTLELLPGTIDEIADRCGAQRVDRLEAWLRVGLELGELRREDGRWVTTGRRARAVAADDGLVAPFYRSVAEYYFGPHLELLDLIGPNAGRNDLSQSAGTIADVSRVTEHVVAGVVLEAASDVQPATWLEVGCGSGVHLATVLSTQPELTAVAVDLDAGVIDDAVARFAELGVHDRVDFRVGDVLSVVAPSERFDVVTLLNNIYYFPEPSRPGLMDHLSQMVNPGGEFIVASQCAAGVGDRGSVAAAQLDFLLRVQAEAEASLPTASDLESLVSNAVGVLSVDVCRPVPGEPYVVIRGKV